MLLLPRSTALTIGLSSLARNTGISIGSNIPSQNTVRGCSYKVQRDGE